MRSLYSIKLSLIYITRSYYNFIIPADKKSKDKDGNSSTVTVNENEFPEAAIDEMRAQMELGEYQVVIGIGIVIVI